jgi:hypothetical protein
MKKIILFLVFLASIFSTNAQIPLQYFTAKDGYDAAFDEVSNIFIEPKLFFLGAVFMDNEVLGQLKYDFKTGKANFWIYGFVDNFDTTKKVVVGTMKLFTYMAQVFDPEDIDPNDFPYLSGNYLSDMNWMDSDSANYYFKQCIPYLDFVNSNKQPIAVNLGLFFNTDFEDLPANIPVWAAYIQLSEQGEFISPAVNIDTREVYCSYFTSVNDYISKINNIYISRNGDYLTLTSSSELNTLDLNIYSLDGRNVFSKVFTSSSNTENIYVPFSSLHNGTYIIIAKNRNNMGVLKLNLIK